MKFVHSFQSLQPTWIIHQSDLIHWISLWQTGEFTKLVQRYACKPPYIESRGSWISSFSDQIQNESFVHETAQQRNQRFLKITSEAFEHLYADSWAPKNILHVTCTGYLSPSAPQILVSNKKWTTQVAHAYHMGCYAAIPAVRLANNTDVVHTELCSLHFQAQTFSPEQVVIQSLFSDGIIKYSVTDQPNELCFEFLASQELILPQSQNHMTWQNADLGFNMTLDRNVPNVISEKLQEVVSIFLNQHGFCLNELLIAVHPGGPKIIQLSQELLALDTSQIQHSTNVLRLRGNMSSATLPHIWQNMLNDPNVKNGQVILSIAFGPGLTLCLSLLRKKR